MLIKSHSKNNFLFTNKSYYYITNLYNNIYILHNCKINICIYLYALI
jgi:hypothetical protein